jgi:hypothetical protein
VVPRLKLLASIGTDYLRSMRLGDVGVRDAVDDSGYVVDGEGAMNRDQHALADRSIRRGYRETLRRQERTPTLDIVHGVKSCTSKKTYRHLPP